MARDWSISEDPVQPLRWLGELSLLERLGEHSWVVWASTGGIEAVARPLAVPASGGPDPATVARAAAAAIGPGDGTLLPVAGIGTHRNRPWLASEIDTGVDLRRFLDVVRPSPAQALLAAGDLLSALRQLHGTGRVHTRLHPGNVQLGADGTARLGDWAVADAPAPERAGDLRRQDLLAVADLVDILARSARCPAGSGSPAARLLTRLPRQLRARTPQPDPGRIVEELRDALGDGVTRDELRAETAQLVEAAGRPWNRPAPDPADRADAPGPPVSVLRPAPPPDRPVPGVPGVPGGSPVAVPDGRPAPARRPGAPRRLDRWTRTVWSLSAALAVLGLVVGAELTFLHRPIVKDLQALRQPAPASSTPAGPVAAVPVASVPPGGPVRSIDLRSLQPCSPGHPCEVRILLDLRPQPRPVEVTWTVELYDRCSASTLNAAGGHQVLAAGHDQVVGLASVPLPSWSALGMVVHTTAPGAASGAPLLVPAAATCPGASPSRSG